MPLFANYRFKQVLILSLAIILVGGGVLFFYWRSPSTPIKKSNILIIHISSLKREYLLNNQLKEPALTSNINKLAQKSFVLANVFNTRFHSVKAWPIDKLLARIYSESNYIAIGENWNLNKTLSRGFDPLNPPPNYFIRIEKKFLKLGLQWIKKKIYQPHSQAFILYLHFQFLQPPFYMPILNEHYKKLLSPHLFKKLSAYIENPLTYPNQFPLFFLLFGSRASAYHSNIFDTLNAKIRPQISSDYKSYWDPLNFISKDSAALTVWKNDSSYKDDLDLLHAIYKAQVAYLDQQLSDLLDLYGDPTLKKNTAVMLFSDHGEALMEHDNLGKTGLYDEVIHTPVLVHLPKQKKMYSINLQFSQNVIPAITKGIMKSKINEDHLITFLTPFNTFHTYTHDAQQALYSLRYHNRWKIIYNKNTQQYLMYDLRTDPLEEHNIYEPQSLQSKFLKESLEPFWDLKNKKFWRKNRAWKNNKKHIGQPGSY